jgi:ribonuclease P/MRP protein subunit RPP40
MNGQALETTEERDMGVAVSANLKPAAQCFKAARTAQTVLGRVGRAFRYGGRQVFIKPYKQYVRHQLEFPTQAVALVSDRQGVRKMV